MTTPVRRLSPAVYRRRRLTVLAALLAVIAVTVWLLVTQPWQGIAAEPDATVSPAISADTPTPDPVVEAPVSETPLPVSETPAPASETPAPIAACTGADLTVEALTDATEYPAGVNPQLSIRLTNRSALDCTMNVGTTGQTLTVTSGDDVWWRSTDCQSAPADQIVTLAAGQSVTSVTPITWDRTRSSVDTCAGERPVAPGGGATYRLSVSIGGVPSSNEAGFLLY